MKSKQKQNHAVTPLNLRSCPMNYLSELKCFREFVLPKQEIFQVSPQCLFGIGDLDALSICFNKINSDFIKDQEALKASSRMKDLAFYKVQRFRYVDIEFLIFSDPKDTKKCKQFQIQVNPRLFPNFKRLKTFLYQIIHDRNECHITRIDVSILLPKKYFTNELMFQTFWAKGKSIQEWYGSINSISKGGFRESVIFGRRSGRLICYDKSIKYNRNVKNRSNHINMEIQLGRDSLKSLGIGNIKTLPNILKLNPFSEFSFVNIFHINKRLSRKDLKSAEDVQLLSLIYGFHTARAMYYKQSNRNARPELFFEELKVSSYNIPFSEIMAESLKVGLTSFFKGRHFRCPPLFTNFERR